MSEILTATFLKLKHGRTKFVCIDLSLSLPNVLTCEMRALLFYHTGCLWRFTSVCKVSICNNELKIICEKSTGLFP